MWSVHVPCVKTLHDIFNVLKCDEEVTIDFCTNGKMMIRSHLLGKMAVVLVEISSNTLSDDHNCDADVQMCLRTTNMSNVFKELVTYDKKSHVSMKINDVTLIVNVFAEDGTELACYEIPSNNSSASNEVMDELPHIDFDFTFRVCPKQLHKVLRKEDTTWKIACDRKSTLQLIEKTDNVTSRRFMSIPNQQELDFCFTFAKAVMTLVVQFLQLCSQKSNAPDFFTKKKKQKTFDNKIAVMCGDLTPL